MSKIITQFKNGEIFPWERTFTRETLNVAIPIVIQSMFMAAMHIVDNVMIGRLGELELASVTQANRITFLFQLVVFGLTGGTSALVAQFWGKQDIKGIHSTLGLALCLSLVSATLFIIPCQVVPRQLMHLLLTDAQAIEYATEYLRVVSVGYLFTAISQSYMTVLKSTEQAKIPMIADIIGLVCNTFLNYCLIFGNFGFPRLGVQGGAIATTISILITLLIVVTVGYRRKLAIAARVADLIPRSLAFAKRYLRVALPVIFNEGLWSLGMVMYSVVYGRMGVGVVAAVSIFNTVEQVALAGNRGLTSACAVLVGKRIGAGDEQDAQKAARRMLYAGVPVGLLSGVLLLIVSIPIVSTFNVSETVAKNALTLIRISACTLWLGQLGGLLVVGIMRAGGDVNMSLLLDAGTTWFIGVPLVALGGLVLGLEIPYVFALSYVEAIVKILLGLWRFKSKKWIHNLVR